MRPPCGLHPSRHRFAAPQDEGKQRNTQWKAEAAAIEARAQALGTKPNLVTLVQAERWKWRAANRHGARLYRAVRVGEIGLKHRPARERL